MDRARLLSQIDRKRSLDFLASMIRYKSYSGTPGESELARFQQQKLRIRKELRSVRLGLDQDITRLGDVLKVVNIVVAPIVFVVAALLIGQRRRRGASGHAASAAPPPAAGSSGGASA